MTTYYLQQPTPQAAARQRGVSLIIVLLLLVIVSMLGVASMQISMMGERGARNDRDMQLAWQSAESALADAQYGISQPATNPIDALTLTSGCSSDSATRGYCRPDPTATKPLWLSVDFTDTTNTAQTAEYGTYTGRPFADAGGTPNGPQPVQAPRFIIEDIGPAASAQGSQVTAAYNGGNFNANFGEDYRITALGYGPRSDIQAVVQSIYRN